jgi:sterol desaturase/sphingolipid hydroxylase (fatty acid hydroxylase superfamily)
VLTGPDAATATMLASACVAIATGGLAVWFAVPRARWQARRGRRAIRAAVLLRALLPARVVRSRSGRLDIAAMLFSVTMAGTALGWALISSNWFADGTSAMLRTAFGQRPASGLPQWLIGTIGGVALYLAYEFAYWLDHWLKHRVPVLWEFHKVHHSAESLSMLTNYRVHPMDTILFYNLTSACTGVAAALLGFAFGGAIDPGELGLANFAIFVASNTLSHLQHSHLWISLPGRWGKWLLSPAHHQIHHSIAVRHYDRNFGSTTALFDRLFGTLHLPAATREPLTFGVTGIAYDAHGFRGAVLMPFADAARRIGTWARAGAPRPPRRGRNMADVAGGRAAGAPLSA